MQTWGTIWDIMPGTLRARELCQAYTDLEALYWRIARYSVYAIFVPKTRRQLSQFKKELVELKSHIRWLGGKVPPLWSL